MDPEYAADLGHLTMEELRARRAECQELEVALSYRRRMAQGRLDIVGAERRRRRTGGAPVDHDHLVEQLSDILADRTHEPGVGRLPQLLAPAADELGTADLDDLAGPGMLSALPDQDEAALDRLVRDLSAYEHDVSAQRRALHERIDVLQGEITRRYRVGEASVESLLR